MQIDANCHVIQPLVEAMPFGFPQLSSEKDATDFPVAPKDTQQTYCDHCPTSFRIIRLFQQMLVSPLLHGIQRRAMVARPHGYEYGSS